MNHDDKFMAILVTLIVLGGALLIWSLNRDWVADREREGCVKVTRFNRTLEDAYICPPPDGGAR